MNTGIFIGTAGWSNRAWKGLFYPEGLASSGFLPYYAAQFNAVEINSTFYHIPRSSTTQKWMEQVPPGFKFCIKVSKFITHIKRLKEAEEPLARFFENIHLMQGSLGPLLIQLPPSLQFDKDVCTHFFNLLADKYAAYEFVIEARHESWFDKASIRLLQKFNIGVVISESGGRFPLHEIITSKNIYVRFHGPEKLYGSPHTDEQLKSYADKIVKWHSDGYSCWVFFNNTIGMDAIENANTLKHSLGI